MSEKKKIAGSRLALAALLASTVSIAAAEAQPAIDTANPWMIRLRMLGVLPDASAKIDQSPGATVNIDNSAVPEVDFTYFFTPNIAAELIAAVTPHRISGAGSLNGVSVGKTWLLPPTVTLQYHFTQFGPLVPYVGAGLNYTFFYDQHAAGGTVTQISVKDTVGGAVQFGADYMLTPHWGINLDVKRLFLRPDVTLNRGALTGSVTIDPWLVGLGAVYKF
jgi:outer membrane protein